MKETGAPSASGKAILLGEYAVAYGVPAITVGIPKEATAVAHRAEAATIRVGDHTAVARDDSELGRCFGALLDAAGAGRDSIAVAVTLDIPAGVDLGAPSAIAVAVARAVLELVDGVKPGLDRVVDVAMAWARVLHDNPEGIDAWAAAHGGCLLFKPGSGIKPIHVARRIPLAIAVGAPSTNIVVGGLARLREKKSEMVNKSLAGIESLVKNAALCIDAGDLIGLGKLLDLNQMLLSGLFLSSEEIESACAWAREAGALGAKLTGSGGGGCVIALAEENPEPILDAWRAQNLECFASTVEADAAPGAP